MPYTPSPNRKLRDRVRDRRFRDEVGISTDRAVDIVKRRDAPEDIQRELRVQEAKRTGAFDVIRDKFNRDNARAGLQMDKDSRITQAVANQKAVSDTGPTRKEQRQIEQQKKQAEMAKQQAAEAKARNEALTQAAEAKAIEEEAIAAAKKARFKSRDDALASEHTSKSSYATTLKTQANAAQRKLEDLQKAQAKAAQDSAAPPKGLEEASTAYEALRIAAAKAEDEALKASKNIDAWKESSRSDRLAVEEFEIGIPVRKVKRASGIEVSDTLTLPQVEMTKIGGGQSVEVQGGQKQPVNPVSARGLLAVGAMKDFLAVVPDSRLHADMEDSIRAREESPDEWENAQVDALQAATPDVIAGQLETWNQVSRQHVLKVEEMQQQFNAARQMSMQKIDALDNDNARAMLDGKFSMSDRVIDGQGNPWSKVLWTERQRLMQQMDQEKAEMEEAFAKEQNELERTNRIQTARQARLQELQAEDKMKRAKAIDEQAANMRASGMTGEADQFERMTGEYEAREKMVAEKFPQDGPARRAALKALADEKQAAAKLLDDNMKAKPEKAADLHSSWAKDLSYDWSKVKEGDDIYLRMKQEAEKRGMSFEDAKFWLTTMDQMDWSKASNIEANAKGLDSKAQPGSTRMLPNGGVLVNPSLLLDAKAFEEALKASNATQEAQDRARKARQEEAPAMAAEMLKTLRKNSDFAAWLEKNTKGSDLERMEQFVAQMREGGAGNMAKMKVGEGLAGLGKSWTGAMAAITGADMFTQGKVPSMLSAKTWEDRAAAYGYASAQSEKETNILTSYMAKAAGIMPSVMASLSAGAAAGGVLKGAAAFRGAKAMAQTGFQLKKGADFATAAAKAGGWSEKAATAAGVAGSSIDAGLQSLGGTYVDAYSEALKKEFGSMAFDADGVKPTEEQIIAAKDKARAAALMPAIASGLTTAAVTALGGAGGVEAVFKGKGSQSLADAIKAPLLRKMAGMGLEGGSEFIEEFSDQLAQGAIAQFSYNPEMSPADVLEQAIEAGVLGFVAGAGIKGVQELKGWERTPEGKAAADATLADEMGRITDPAVKAQAQAVQSVLEGRSFGQLTESQLAALNLKRQGDKFVQADKAVPVGAYEQDGQIVLTDDVLDSALTNVPGLNVYAPASEKARLDQIAEGATGQSARQPNVEGALSDDQPSSPATKPAPEAQSAPAAASEGAAISSPVDQAAQAAATSKANDLPQPTDAQKKAGNYPMGHVKLSGLDITIENPDGSERSWTNEDTGEKGVSKINGHYGYIKNTVGADGDHVDALVKPGTPEDWNGTVYVIKQLKSDGKTFDEHKIYIGFESEAEAKKAYKSNYQKGWRGYGGFTPMSISQLAADVKAGNLKSSTPQSTNEATEETTAEAEIVTEPEDGAGVVKTPKEWAQEAGIRIISPDGWAGKNGRPFDQPISKYEFFSRVSASTIIPPAEGWDAFSSWAKQPAGPDSDASPAEGQDADRDGNAQGEWSIRTQSGQRLSIPASEASNAKQAIDIFAGMAKRGDLLDTSSLIEPDEGGEQAPAQKPEPEDKTTSEFFLPEDTETIETADANPAMIAKMITDAVNGLADEAPVALRRSIKDIGVAIVQSFLPYVKAGTYKGIKIATGEYNGEDVGAGYAIQGEYIVIMPRHFARTVLNAALGSGENFSQVAADLIELGPLHEFFHVVTRRHVGDSEAARIWRSLPQSIRDKFKLAYTFGAENKMSDAYLGHEFLRNRLEAVFTGKTSEQIYGISIEGDEYFSVIAKLIASLTDLLKDIAASLTGKDRATFEKVMNKAIANSKKAMPKEVLADLEARAAQEGRTIGGEPATKQQAESDRKPMAGDVSSPIRAEEAQADVGAIGSSQKARAFIEANFKAMAEKMGITLVPNMAGVSARYVVSENGKSRGGYIEYNPVKLAERTPGQIMDVMREEIIHAAKDKILVERVMKQKGIKITDPYIQSGQHHIDFYRSIHDMMTPQEREWTKKVYKSHGNRDYVIGSEFDRMVTQREVFGGLTEQAMTKGKKGVSRSKALEAIKRLLKEVEAYVRRMASSNTPAAKQAKAVHTATIKMLIDIETNQKMMQAATAPSIPLQVAVRISDKVVLGKPGQTHYDVMADWIFKNEMTASQRSHRDAEGDKYDRITSDWFERHNIQTGFMADKFLDRKQAWQMLKNRGLKMPSRALLPGRPSEEMLDSLDLPEIERMNAPSVQASTAPVLPVAPQLNLVYAQADEKRPAKREASNPLDQTAGIGAIEAFGGATQTPALLAWATENGWLVEGQDLVNRLAPGGPVEEIQGGDEHDVWFDPITQRAIKLTLDDNWIAGTPSGYIENLIRQNAEFGAGYAFEGIVNDNGTARLVLSQPWVIGKPATNGQIDEFFAERDYGKVKDGMFYHERKKLSVGDALPRNVLRTQDGRMQPIDVQVRVPSERQQNAYEDAIQARSNQAQAATAPIPAFNRKAAGELLADFRKLPQAEEGGDTLNLDGTKYTKGGLVVPVVSRNFDDFKEVKPEDIEQFISPDNIDIATAGGNVAKVGFYKFPNSQRASIDLNIIAPREMRKEALAIGKDLEQESLFDLDTFENVKTGADGKNPRRPNAKEVAQIRSKLTKPEKSQTTSASLTPYEEIDRANSKSDIDDLVNKYERAAKTSSIKSLYNKYIRLAKEKSERLNLESLIDPIRLAQVREMFNERSNRLNAGLKDIGLPYVSLKEKSTGGAAWSYNGSHSIEYNPFMFVQKNLTNQQVMRVFSHEAIHTIGSMIVGKRAIEMGENPQEAIEGVFSAIAETMTPEERRAIQAKYDMSDADDMTEGFEFFRSIVEEQLFGDFTEDHFRVSRENPSLARRLAYWLLDAIKSYLSRSSNTDVLRLANEVTSIMRSSFNDEFNAESNGVKIEEYLERLESRKIRLKDDAGDPPGELPENEVLKNWTPPPSRQQPIELNLWDRIMRKIIAMFPSSSIGQQGPLQASRADVVGGKDLKGDGRSFSKFFATVTQGAADKYKPAGNYTPAIDLKPDAKAFQIVRYRFRGNFDDHIATSIPGFDEVQAVVGSAIVKAYGEGGGSVLDIGASEGALNKAITSLSGGKIKTVALDPNVSMMSTFKGKDQVDGATFELAAFGSDEEAGQVAWTEDDGTAIKFYNPGSKKFDVVHEAMVFQFISNARNAQVLRVKQLMKPDGIAIFEQKFGDRKDAFDANEDKKDRDWKSRHYTLEQLEQKRQDVLNSGGDQVEGMTALQVAHWEMEEVLRRNFKNVVQFWSSGNFRGYMASDSQQAIGAMLDGMQTTESEFATVPTPRVVAGSVQAATAPELNLGRKGDPTVLRQKNVKRLIEKQAAAHPEALPVEYIKDGKLFRLDEKGMPIASPQKYDLDESGLFKTSAKGLRGEQRMRSYVLALADKLEGFFNQIKDQPEVMAGKEWYRVAREKLTKAFGEHAPLFSQLLAATSARTPVKQNFEQALDAFNQMTSGAFDGVTERYLNALKSMEAGELVFRKSIGNNKMGDTVTPKTMRDWLDVEGILPRRSNGKKYNANSMQVLNVIAGVWREKLGGPKTAQFSDNLSGASNEATIDVWAARTLHRLSNEGYADKWRILPEAETGVDQGDFDIGQNAFRVAAARLGMNPDDLQGVLWFAEKRHWADKGWTRAAGAELSDFSSLLDFVSNEGGKLVLRIDDGQSMMVFDEPTTNTNQPRNARIQAGKDGGPGTDRARAGRPVSGRSAASARGATGRGPERVAEEQEQALFATAPAFYSKLEQFIESRMPTTADSAAVAAMIELPTSGVKKDEIKWSGIKQWLASRGDKVKRQEVLDYLRGEGRIKFNEVRLFGQIGDMPAADILDITRNNLEDRGQSYEEWEAMEETLYDAIKDWKADESERNRRAVERIIGIPLGELDMPPGSAATEFSEHVLPGGENYREVVVTMPMPTSRIEYEIEEIKYDDGSVRYRAKGPNFRSRAVATRAAAEKDLAEMRSSYDAIDSRAQSYTSRHFSKIPNYLAHTRLNDRVGADGKPGTFIEELQSDRHQKGRKEGYAEDGPTLANEDLDQTSNRLFRKDYNALPPDEKIMVDNYIKEYGPRAYVSKPAGTVPDAPYRKDWPLMLFKRGLVDAVANGKQWIGWTTGDTQNDRYALEKHLSEVSLSKPFAGDERVHLEAYDKNSRRIIDTIIEQGEVAEYVGEELAARLEAMPFTKLDVETSNGSIVSRDTKRLRGLDLKVKGEAMRKFYDKMVVDEVRKYVKQWGAGVVKDGMPTGFVPRRFADGQWYLSYAGNVKEVDSRRFATREEALAAQYPIWRVDITPQMRESIKATGQPMFATAPNLGKDYSKLTDAEYDAIPIHEIKRHRSLQRLTETRRALQALAETGGSAGGYTTPAITRVLKEQGFKEIASIDQLGYKWDLTKVEGGAEHFVWVTNEQDGPVRAIKIARGNRGIYGNYGISHHVVPYVERIEAANQIFGDDMRVEGYHPDGRLWVSQPWIDGVHPEPSELRDELIKRGWRQDPKSPSGSSYLSPDGRIMLRDAHMLNFVKSSDGEMRPLDIQIEAEATERMRLHPTDEAYPEHSIGALLDSASSVEDFGFTDQHVMAATAPDLGKRLAPNGKPSNLNEKQWVTVRTPAFKEWFGDWEKFHNGKDGNGVWRDSNGEVSKIVDENGEPMVMYHGSRKAGFESFDMTKAPGNRPNSAFFSNNRRVARTYSGSGKDAEIITQDENEFGYFDEHRGIYAVFLNLRNPSEADFEGANWDGSREGQYAVYEDDNKEEMVYAENGRGYFDYESDAKELSDKHPGSVVGRADDHYQTTNDVAFDAKGYKNDGAIVRNVHDDGGEFDTFEASDVVIVFDPENIKDANNNNGEFSPSDIRILFATAPDYLKGLGPDPASALLTKMAKQLPTNEQMADFGEKAEVVLPGATPEQRQRAVAEWVRKSDAPPEKVKQWEAKARRMIEDDKQGVIDQVIQNYFDGADFGSPELAMAASILTPELFKEAVASGNPDLMRKAQAFAYAHGAGATQAGRTLRALNNPHKANKDHIREMFAKMLVTVGPRERARIATAPTPMAKEKKIKELQQKLRELERKVANGEISRAKETAALRKMLSDARAQLDKQQLIESYTKARSEKVRETLKLEGMTEDDIFIDAEDRLAAQDSDLVSRALEKHPETQHEAIRYLMRGYSHEEVSKLVGMPKLAIAALHEKFRNQTLKKEVAAHVKSGNSVMDLIRNGLKKVLGLRASAPVEWGNVNKVPGLAADLKAKEAQRAANAAANAAKVKDVSVDMNLSQEIDRQLALLMPTSTQVNGTNNLKAVIVRRKGQEEVTMHVPFNPGDFQSVYRLARAISIAEASTFDKMTEWWINGMLSGPETNFVNIAGNTIATAIHFGPQRMMEIGWNIFLQDEGSASLGELKYIARGILPGIREGLKNAALAFSAEGDITGHRYLDEPMQLTFDPNGDIAKIGGYRGPAIAGKKGRIIRISGRLLRAMDALFKTFIGQAEVGAQAYRLGRIAGKTGADLESFITKQINTPGSKAWHLSMQEATELTFQSDNWLTDLAKTVTQTDQSKIERLMTESVEAEADGNFMKARTAKASANMLIIWSSLLKLVFPFVKTPANILRVGVRKSPLGSLVLASHAIQVFGRGVINMRNGKAFIDGADKAEFVRLLSEQTQAWVMAGFFLSAIEGDDDDDKKKLLLVGGRAPMDYGGREAAGRDYGGTYLVVVRDDDGKETRIPFGRYDPVATALGTTIDTIKQVKDSIRRNRNGEEGGDVGATIKAIMADFMNQASDKSFLQGFSSMMKHVDSIRQGRDVGQTIGKSLQYSILTALVPNIIRQPLRNLDNKVRDYDKVYDGYTALPIGDLAEPKIDIFGRDVEKGEMFPGSRVIIRSADKQQPRLPIQEHIQAWNNKNLNEQFKPTGLRNTDYYGYVGKQKQAITDPAMRSEMDRAIGQEFARRSTIMAENNDPQNLPEDFGKKLKDLYSDVKSEVRKKMLTSPFSSIKSSITQQPKP